MEGERLAAPLKKKNNCEALKLGSSEVGPFAWSWVWGMSVAASTSAGLIFGSPSPKSVHPKYNFL